MPRVVSELLVEAVREGLSMFAHSLFVAMQEKIISPNDSEFDIDYNQFPIDKCLAAHQANVLCINPTQLFAIPYENHFSMYLSKSLEDARTLHQKLFHTIPTKIFNMTDKIDTDVYDLQTKKTESFSEIRDRTINLPAFICFMKKG